MIGLHRVENHVNQKNHIKISGSDNMSKKDTMETGNHFKNGANPKSLTSRENNNILIK
jgi:hypothetical protein